MAVPLLCCQFGDGLGEAIFLALVLFVGVPMAGLLMLVVMVIRNLKKPPATPRSPDDPAAVAARRASEREVALARARAAVQQATRSEASAELVRMDTPEPRAPLPLVRRGWW